MGSVLEILLAFLPTLIKHLDDAVQLSRLCYNYPVIQNYYTSRRQKCERSSRYSTSRAFKNHFRSYLYKKSKLSQNRIHYVIKKKKIKGVAFSVKYMNLSPAWPTVYIFILEFEYSYLLFLNLLTTWLIYWRRFYKYTFFPENSYSEENLKQLLLKPKMYHVSYFTFFPLTFVIQHFIFFFIAFISLFFKYKLPLPLKYICGWVLWNKDIKVIKEKRVMFYSLDSTLGL